jgi:hypothetical protein
MRVEIVDPTGYAVAIVSKNADTIARWFAEYVPQIVQNTAAYQYQLRVWPQDAAESEALKVGNGEMWTLDQDGLLSLAGTILQASKDIADHRAMRAAARPR